MIDYECLSWIFFNDLKCVLKYTQRKDAFITLLYYHQFSEMIWQCTIKKKGSA